MEFKIPHPLNLEHAELHEELVKATKESGKVGEAARTVARVMHEHFVKEEKYALPPLGLLPLLAAGEISPAMKSVLAMTDKLKADLPLMMAEHKAIAAALDLLVKAATEAGKTNTARFAEKLKLHAQTEEEVLYPAAILIGEYLKLQLGN